MAEDEAPDDADALIAWLDGKSEDVWFDTVDHINWDDGVPVLMWMTDQPQCTRALAARIFWTAAPDFYAIQMLAGETFDEDIDESWPLLQQILKNWRAGLYASGQIAFESPGAVYREMLSRHPGRGDPLNIPESLCVSLPGRLSAAARETKAPPAETTPFLRVAGLVLFFGSLVIIAALVAHRLRKGSW